MLLAEEFVLLALDPDGSPARGHSNQSTVALGVVGALVTELAQDGHVDLTDGRIRLTGTRPEHPQLGVTLDELGRHEGKKLKSRFTDIKRSGWKEVVEGLEAAGVLGHDKQALRPTLHPVLDGPAHQLLLARVRAAATGDGPLDPRDAGLLALAGPCRLLEVVAPDRSDHRRAKRRIAQASEDVPAAAAVKLVIEAMTATIAVAASSAAITSS